jgi:hypothetical protein
LNEKTKSAKWEVLLIIGFITAILIFTTSHIFAEIPDNLTALDDKNQTTMYQYCKSNPNGNIQEDLINTGKIGSNYTGWTCDYVRDLQKQYDELSKSITDLMDKLNQ